MFGQLDAGDDALVDLVRTIREAQAARLGEEPRERRIVREPRAAVHLDGVVHDLLNSTLGATTLMAEISVIAPRAPASSIFHAA